MKKIINILKDINEAEDLSKSQSWKNFSNKIKIDYNPKNIKKILSS